MPSIRSQSTSTSPRGGFTLIEVVVATALAGLIMALAFNAYQGANKAKSLSGSSGLLKDATEKAIANIFEDLHKNRHLFDRGAVAQSFLARLDLQGCAASSTNSPGVTSGDLLLPAIKESGSFWQNDRSGSPNPNFDNTSVGNTLFFIAQDPKVILSDQNNVLSTACHGATSVMIPTYRIHLYYLARRNLPVGTNPVRGVYGFTYQLMHWTSARYIDYSEFMKLINRIQDKVDASAITSSDAHTWENSKLTTLAGLTPPFAGALDVTVTDGSTGASPNALHALAMDTSTYRDLNSSNALFALGKMGAAANFSMATGFGEAMVAFNTLPTPGPSTAPSPGPGIPVMNLTVPRYAPTPPTYPYGLEVMIGGSPDDRQVLLHLSTAALTTPGNVMVGEELQQVVQVSDQ